MDQAGITSGCELDVEELNASSNLCMPRSIPRKKSVVTLNDFIRHPDVPLKFPFRYSPLHVRDDQFELVREESLEVPLAVATPDDPAELSRSKFVVNLSKCFFHETQDDVFRYDCPTYPFGVCHCGVLTLFDAMMEELKNRFGFKISRQQRRHMESRRQQALGDYANEFRPRLPIRTGQSAAAGSCPYAATAGMSLAGQIRRVLQLANQDPSHLKAEDRAVLELVEELAEKKQREHQRKVHAYDPQAAWLGDRINDCYLASYGTLCELTPHQFDQVRQEVLSTKGLSGGLNKRDISEGVEAQVGIAARQHSQKVVNLLGPWLRVARVPPGDRTLLECLRHAVDSRQQ